MRRLVEIAKTGLTAILLHPVRSSVTLCALMAILVPYVTGIGLAKGLEQNAQLSIDLGGDLYLSGSQFGRNIPLPLDLESRVLKTEGVIEVVPRIVGRIVLGAAHVEAVVVGIPVSQFPDSIDCIEGRLPAQGATNEFVIGTELAHRLKLQVGSLLPPFYHNSNGERVSKIVGLFNSEITLWQSHVMFSTFETAEEVFNQKGLVTDFVIHCQPGYEDNLNSTLRRQLSDSPNSAKHPTSLQVTSREALNVLLANTQHHREGIFNLHFLLVFTIGILVILVTSGLGLSERRREIGILKATGWQTDEVILRNLTESFLLSVGGASLSIMIAFVWLKLFNGFWIASIFISGVSYSPSFQIPYVIAPVPAILAFMIALVITMTGTLWSTWRAAVVAPSEAMR